MVVCLGLRCRFRMGALRRRLFSLVMGWIGTLAPAVCILQYELATAMPWKEEMMLSGRGSWKRSQHFSWNAGWGLACTVVGSQAWPTSVVFDREPSWTFHVWVWSSAWGGGRGLSLLSCITLTGNCLLWGKFKADACRKRVGFKRLICSWCLLRHCFFFPDG